DRRHAREEQGGRPGEARRHHGRERRRGSSGDARARRHPPGARPYPPAGTSRANHRLPSGRAVGAARLVWARRLPRDRARRSAPRAVLVILTPGVKKGREKSGSDPFLSHSRVPSGGRGLTPIFWYGCCSGRLVNPERTADMAKSKAKASGAIELLKEQHDKVKKAFKEFEKLDREDTETQEQLVQTVCEDLKVHTTLEEELFYPAAREAIDDEDLLNEAQVEHETAKMLIEQLENMGADDPNFRATFSVLGEYVMHH